MPKKVGTFWKSVAGTAKYSQSFSFAKVLSKEVVRKHRESLFDYLSDKQHIMNFGKSLSDAIDGLSKQIQERANVISGMLAADGVAPNSNFRNLIDKIKMRRFRCRHRCLIRTMRF